MDSIVTEIKGDKQVTGVTVLNNATGQTTDLAVNGVFVQVGEAPNSHWQKRRVLKLTSVNT
jgi:thioredoxin reductase (NADPH)